MAETAEGLPSAALTKGRRRFLRYWALNVAFARQGGWGSIPGFAYTDAETSRLDELAHGFSRSGILIWLAATTVIYIVLAAVVLAVVMGAALSLLWPDSTKVPEAGFFTALGLVLVLMIGLGLPSSIALGGALADALSPPWTLADSPDDPALAAKVGRQFRRMGLVMAVLVIAGATGWAAFFRT